MDNEEIDLEQYEPLIPHQYPLWLKLGAIGAFIMIVYALSLSLPYYDAAKELKRGRTALQRDDFAIAAKSLQRVLLIAPSSRAAKLMLAETYFSNSNQDDDGWGLELLEDVELDEYEWSDLSKVMPAEYQEYFEEVEEE